VLRRIPQHQKHARGHRRRTCPGTGCASASFALRPFFTLVFSAAAIHANIKFPSAFMLTGDAGFRSDSISSSCRHVRLHKSGDPYYTMG
jgi:hypothetical protein